MTGKKRAEPPEEVDVVAPEGMPSAKVGAAGAEAPADAPAGAETDPRVAELARLRSREDELLRALAEQQNVHRRRRQDMDASLRMAQEDWVRELLPVLDDFDRAILAMGTEQAEPIRAGVTLVRDRLVRILERQGLEAIRPLGEPFDPSLHDAIAQLPDPKTRSGTVLEVVEPGYRLRDRVLRHAKVIVAGPAREGRDEGKD